MLPCSLYFARIFYIYIFPWGIGKISSFCRWRRYRIENCPNWKHITRIRTADILKKYNGLDVQLHRSIQINRVNPVSKITGYDLVVKIHVKNNGFKPKRRNYHCNLNNEETQSNCQGRPWRELLSEKNRYCPSLIIVFNMDLIYKYLDQQWSS